MSDRVTGQVQEVLKEEHGDLTENDEPYASPAKKADRPSQSGSPPPTPYNPSSSQQNLVSGKRRGADLKGTKQKKLKMQDEERNKDKGNSDEEERNSDEDE